jgi:Skp family chaperone for outer membrane proteins
MYRIFFYFGLAAALMMSEAAAQEFKHRAYEGRERLETIQLVRLIETLELDEATAAQLTALYSGFRSENRTLLREMEELTDALERAIEEEQPDAELRVIRNRIEELRGSMHGNRLRLYRDAEKILTERQLSQLVVFERNFGRDLRTIMRNAGRDRRRGR